MISNFKRVLKEVDYPALLKQYVNLLCQKDRVMNDIERLNSGFMSLKQKYDELNNSFEKSVDKIDDGESEDVSRLIRTLATELEMGSDISDFEHFEAIESGLKSEVSNQNWLEVETHIDQLYEFAGRMKILTNQMNDLYRELLVVESKLIHVIPEIQLRQKEVQLIA